MKNKNRQRLTIILGAGSLRDLGFSSTKKLTLFLMNKTILATKGKKNPITIYKFIYYELLSYFNKFSQEDEQYSINFEDIIYSLENLYSLSISKIPITEIPVAPIFKPHIGTFINFKDTINNFSVNDFETGLNNGLNIIRNKIIEEINKYKTKIGTAKWYSDFWKNLKNHYYLDIISLNYDNILEKIIFENDEFINGFVKINNKSEISVFNYNNLLTSTDKHRIIRIHGSVNFSTIHNKNFWKRKYNIANEGDLFWIENERKILPRYIYKYHSINNELILIGSLIMGHRKLNKLYYEPYISYHAILSKIISESPNLLIIGFSFNDLHINSIIGRLFQYHRKKSKTIIVDNSKYATYSIYKYFYKLAGLQFKYRELSPRQKAYIDYLTIHSKNKNVKFINKNFKDIKIDDILNFYI